MHLKIIITKKVLNRNKASGVYNKNTNRKQEKGKKCDLFLLIVTDLNQIAEICKKGDKIRTASRNSEHLYSTSHFKMVVDFQMISALNCY